MCAAQHPHQCRWIAWIFTFHLSNGPRNVAQQGPRKLPEISHTQGWHGTSQYTQYCTCMHAASEWHQDLQENLGYMLYKSLNIYTKRWFYPSGLGICQRSCSSPSLCTDDVGFSMSLLWSLSWSKTMMYSETTPMYLNHQSISSWQWLSFRWDILGMLHPWLILHRKQDLLKNSQTTVSQQLND